MTIKWVHTVVSASLSLGIGFAVEGMWGPGVGFMLFGVLSVIPWARVKK